MPQRFIAAAIRVPQPTLESWLRDDPDFSFAAREAEAEGILQLIEMTRASAKPGGAAWMLERRYPSEFGRQDRQPIDMEKQLREYAEQHGLDADEVIREAQAVLKGGK